MASGEVNYEEVDFVIDGLFAAAGGLQKAPAQAPEEAPEEVKRAQASEEVEPTQVPEEVIPALAPKEVVAALGDSLNEGDLEGAMVFIAEEMVFDIEGEEMHGADNVRGMFEELIAGNFRIQLDVQDVDGNTVTGDPDLGGRYPPGRGAKRGHGNVCCRRRPDRQDRLGADGGNNCQIDGCFRST